MHRIFSFKCDTTSKTTALKAWETKRFTFNLVNLSVSLIFSIPLYTVLPGSINFFLLPFVIGYFIFLNVFFTLGFLILKTILSLNKELSPKLAISVIWICFFWISLFLTSFLCLGYILINIP